MAFQYTTADEPPPPPPPPPYWNGQHHQSLPQSSYSCFAGQPSGADYRIPSFGLGVDYISQGMGHTSGYRGQGHSWINENFQISKIVREEIQRAIEKERIRDEIIAGEIARRRILEAEVREELRMERELALRVKEGSTTDKVPYPVDTGIPLAPRGNPFLQEAKGLTLEERIAMYVEERLRMRARLEAQGFDAVPFQPIRTINPKVEAAVSSLSESGRQKEKIVFLVKPGANPSVAKSKAVSPSEESANLLLRVGNRKGNGSWSCEICGVSTTSERVLNEHIQGKKHKAALQGKRNGCYIGLGVLPNNNLKSMIEVTPVLNPAQELKSGGEVPQIGQSEPSSLHNVSSKCLDENSVSVMAKNRKLKEKIPQKAPNKQKEKDNFMFWCAMCQVGADHEKVMEEHRNSKKHAKALQKAGDNDQAILIPHIIGSVGKNGSKEATEGDNQAFNNVNCTTREDHVESKDLDASEKVKQEIETEHFGEDPTLGFRETSIQNQSQSQCPEPDNCYWRSWPSRVSLATEENSWEMIHKNRRYAGQRDVYHYDQLQEQLNAQFARPQISRDQGVKPGVDVSRTKSKVVPPAEESVNQLLSVGNSEGNEVWSCKICGVSTTSDRVLIEHIQGKKHKAALDGKKKGFNIRLGVLSNNDLMPVMEVSHVSISEQELISGEEDPQIGQSDPSSLCILSTKCLDENSTSIMQGDAKNKKPEDKILQTSLNELKKKNNFTFWCEMCQVGSDHEKVMEGHWKGKKHLKSLQKATGQAILIPQILGTQGEHGSNGATKRDNQASDNVDGTTKVEHVKSTVLNGHEDVKQEVETSISGEGPTWGCREAIVKPEADISETKRKVASPAAESTENQLSVIGNAEGNRVWSCEICGITTTSERGLIEHNQGKKHKSKEAACDK
ncbi:OLC1v1035504C1 [Oldenlandia corymbosa var. corymbosa]|uniref:OLC1v1035504C1 n=1 Tax=Oldenlandia corymbosa var. corymbosa TaxID=529605 RepID=A0AAV1CTN3_OLDCO|nr:OLC1v1035504C1 [Oldenlandia corymbosa var. corymbosa]